MSRSIDFSLTIQAFSPAEFLSFREWSHIGTVCHSASWMQHLLTPSSRDLIDVGSVWTIKAKELQNPSSFAFKFKLFIVPEGDDRLGECAFICVEWQVTLCDVTWQVSLRSSEMGSHSIHTFIWPLARLKLSVAHIRGRGPSNPHHARASTLLKRNAFQTTSQKAM